VCARLSSVLSRSTFGKPVLFLLQETSHRAGGDKGRALPFLAVAVHGGWVFLDDCQVSALPEEDGCTYFMLDKCCKRAGNSCPCLSLDQTLRSDARWSAVVAGRVSGSAGLISN
jgi:hypothetical protein